jgi:hypothetical protein
MKIVVAVTALVVACNSNHNAGSTKPAAVEQNAGSAEPAVVEQNAGSAKPAVVEQAGPECAAAATHLVTFQTNGGDSQKTSAAIAASCQNLKWTAGAINCVKTLKTLDDAPSCMHQMTAEQNLALEEIINK